MFASSSPLNRRLLGGIGPVVPDDGTENNPALMRSQVPGMMFRGYAPFADAPRSVLDMGPNVIPYNPNMGGLAGPTMGSGGMFQPDAAATPELAPPANPDLTGAATQKPGFFSKRGGGLDVLGGVADALSGQPIYSTAQRQRHAEEMQQRSQQALWARDDAQRQQDRQWQVEDRDAAMNKPQFFNAGNDRVRYDPVSGKAEVVYDAPEDYQTYASTLGLNPGDAGYGNAVQDYVLRGSGPTAQKAKLGLEGVRQGNRLQLRGTPTYLQTHPAPPRSRPAAGPRAPSTMGGVVAPILAKMAQGQPLSAGEQQALSTYQAGRGGHRGGGSRSAGGSMPTVRTPAEARALPPGTRFRTPDGREMVR